MKKLLSICILLSLFGCKKDGNPVTDYIVLGITNNVYDVSPYIPFPVFDSIVSINLSDGSVSDIASVKSFSGLEDIIHETRSFNKNLYIYVNSKDIIGVIDLANNKQQLISIENDTLRNDVLSLKVDETDNMLYVVLIAYNNLNHKDSLGIIPISLNTMKVLPKVNFMSASDMGSFCASDINSQTKEIYLKSNQEDSLYILNYRTNSFRTLLFDKILFDLHFNASRNSLFGSGFSQGKFRLFELSLSTGIINKIGDYTGIQLLGSNGYYNKENNAYWMVAVKDNSLKFQLINIDISNAAIIKSFPLKKQLQYIN